MFGMTRTSRVPGGSAAASRASVTPAAIEMIRCRGSTASRTPASTPAIICGLTASTTASHAGEHGGVVGRRAGAGDVAFELGAGRVAGIAC